MFQKRPLTLAIQAALGLTALQSLPAMAAVTQAEAAAANKEIVEEIVVTGSRIERKNEVTSSPVVQLDAEQIVFQGTMRAEDIARSMPQVYLDQDAGQSIESDGVATLQLRNLGPSRTLVLVDGKRLPINSPTSDNSGADLNFIPVPLVQRIEVLTGGASATYGSDAIAGVVNFTMKDDFEGMSFDYQQSGYAHDNSGNVTSHRSLEAGYNPPNGTRHDGDTTDASLIIGGNLSDGRGNVTAYATYRDIKPVTQSERDYSFCALGSGTTSCGGSPTASVGNFQAADGSFYYKVDGNQFVPFDATYFNFAPPSYFQRPDTRYTMGAFAHYDITEQVTAYTQLMWMDDQTVAQFAPAGLFFDPAIDIHCNNPLLSPQQTAAIGCTGPADVITDVYIGRRNVEGGPRFADYNTQSYRGVFGFKGNINDAWRYDVSYQYAQVDLSVRNGNYTNSAKMANALDVVDVNGVPTCRSVTDGSDPACVPWNIWTTGGVTPAAASYFASSYYEKGDTDQTVLTGYVQGDLGTYGVKLPWADSGIDVVLGAERRQENLNYQPDDLSKAGDVGGISAALVPTDGGYTVKEVFTEASIPLVEGKRFAQEIRLDLGYRYSDYTTDVNTNTYKFAGSWAFDNQIKLRASYQRAVRAANIVELFQPINGTLYQGTTEPCEKANPGDALSTSGYTFEQCAREGVTLATWNNGGPRGNSANQYNFIQGGNPDLDPEESDTYSAGFILTPNFAEGSSLTVDWYDIRVDHAITSVNGETTQTNCLLGTGPAADDPACQRVHRGANGTLYLGQAGLNAPDNGVDGIYLNSGFFEVTGIDVEALYRLNIGERWGSVTFDNLLAWVDSWKQEEYPHTTTESCEGLYGASCETPLPAYRNRFTATWATPWNVTLNFTWRYTSEVKMVSGVPDPVDIDSFNFFDLAGVWDITDWVSVRAGVNNVLDETPPITDNGATARNNGNTYPGGYDYMGQYWFLAATFHM